MQPWVNTVFWVCEKGSRVTKCGGGSSGWLVTCLFPRYGCPGALNPPFCAPLGATLRAAVLPGVPASTSNVYRLRTPAGCLSKPVLHDISRTIFTQRGVHDRSLPTSNTPGASRSREPGGLIHTQSPEGKCGTSSVLSGVEDPCQVTSDQNQLLFALWSRSWFISDGDYISVGEHLS